MRDSVRGYVYAHDDPVDLADPSGLAAGGADSEDVSGEGDLGAPAGGSFLNGGATAEPAAPAAAGVQVGAAKQLPLPFDKGGSAGTGLPDDLVPGATARQTIDLSGDWRERLPSVAAEDGLVYVLSDAKSGTLLKVGKTSGPLEAMVDSRLRKYAGAGRRLGLALRMDMWTVPQINGGRVESTEGEVRNALLMMERSLPWDNAGERLGRPGPGVPFITSRTTRVNGWRWQTDPDNANYGRLLDQSGNPFQQDPPYYP